ncbi:DMT family transporter [Marinobacterium jannaschii]|uniref:DMT family transporter n=1 Tax=Marinobacterium jannaschii TaxID=64970 RepID=UPI000484FA43|nr:EamA family transporter [Marinobacterium jannaschii]
MKSAARWLQPLIDQPVSGALAVVLLWGLNVVMMKIGLNDMSPLLFTASRFALLALVLLPFWRIARHQFRDIATLALVMGIGHFCTLAIGISYVDSSVAGLILLLGAPCSSLLAFLFLNERLRPVQVLALLGAVAGIATPILLQQQVELQLGAVIILFSMLVWAAGNLLVRRISDLPVLTVQFWIGIISSPLCMLLWWLQPDSRPFSEQLTGNSIASLLYVVGGSSVLAYYIWYRLISRHSINRIVNLTLLQPLVTMGFGYLLLDEMLSGLQLTGAAVTLAAMWLFYQARQRA